MASMRRSLLKSNFSLVIVIAVFLSFLSAASMNQSAELDETLDSVESLVSQDNDLVSPLGTLFLTTLFDLPIAQFIFLQKDETELFPCSSFSTDTLIPFRGPPSLSA